MFKKTIAADEHGVARDEEGRAFINIPVSSCRPEEWPQLFVKEPLTHEQWSNLTAVLETMKAGLVVQV